MSKVESIVFPTVLLEALFTTLIIGAYEERDVATFDVPGEYLYANIPKGKTILLNLWGGVICHV